LHIQWTMAPYLQLVTSKLMTQLMRFQARLALEYIISISLILHNYWVMLELRVEPLKQTLLTSLQDSFTDFG
jgi:hypothetical protein